MLDTKTFHLSRAIVSPGRSGPDVDEIKRLILPDPELVNTISEFGKYPLVEAAHRGYADAVKILLELGAKVDLAEPKFGSTALHEAVDNAKHGKNPLEVVKLLLAAGANPNASDKTGTPLHSAVNDRSKTHLEIVKTLIASGADVNAVGLRGSVLGIASGEGSPDMVKALLAAGAEVNAVHPWAGTALAAAAEANRPDNAALLLESGANADFRLPADLGNGGRAGKTALEIARAAKAKKIIALLEGPTSTAAGPSKKKPNAEAKAPTVATNWKALEAWLDLNEPDLKKTLNKPAAEKKVAGLEKCIGMKLPPDFRESLKTHDGQKEGAGDLIPAPAAGDTSYFLLASADIAKEWETWKKLYDAGEFANQRSGPDKGVSDAWWNPGWIPFASNGGGDSLCIDLAPVEGGVVGQVITMSHEESKRERLAPSFNQWLTELVLAVQSAAS